MNQHIDELRVPPEVVATTLTSLRAAGARNAEGVVLWLGRRDSGIEVVEAYVPEYESEHDFFAIPRDAMAELLRHLGRTQTFLAAQVHSHPRHAFHSEADDTWAIVRHVGALSLVVPWFAAATSIDTFVADIAAFSLSPQNKWLELDPEAVKGLIRIV